MQPDLITLIPLPNHLARGNGSLHLSGSFQWTTGSSNAQLLELIKRASDYPEFMQTDSTGSPVQIEIKCSCLDTENESYRLEITQSGIALDGQTMTGIFYGIQTLRQLVHIFPNAIPFLTIQDQPRFEWRGLMIDVARHFFKIDDIKAIIDQLATLKFNRLHLHLSDDQGWRIEIPTWPKLTRIGSTTAVNGDPGGFYTRSELKGLIRYAQERFISIIPEIDMPGHTQAAIASYPQLAPEGKSTELYTGIEVGFSTLDPYKEITYQFIEAVISEVADIFPSTYIHIGGDESLSTPLESYIYFIQKVEQIIHNHGKRMIGWEEIGKASPAEGTLLQSWKVEDKTPPPAGLKVILSPANRVYLDMKTDEDCPLGLQWAGYVPLENTYQWDPRNEIVGGDTCAILGIEAALWSETLTNRQEQEWMLYPRLLAMAEVSWTEQDLRGWDSFKARINRLQTWLVKLGIQPGPFPQLNN